MSPKALILMLLLAICGYFASSCQSGPDVAQPLAEMSNNQRIVAKASNDFSFKLLREVVAGETDKNIVISPFSASMALGMTANGAKGLTQEAFTKTLGYGYMSHTSINESYQGLSNILQKADEKVTFLNANSVWYRDTFHVQDDFRQNLHTYFDASVEGLDFTQSEAAKNTINQWVEEKTDGKITQLIRKVEDKHVMFLINAVYFNAPWKYAFNKERTYPASFAVEGGSTVEADMMVCHEGLYHTYWGNNFSLFDLPYGNGQYSMSILLPHEGTSISELTKSLDAVSLDEWISQSHEANEELHLPRFTFSYQKELKQPLTNMGLGIAFTPGSADFNNIFVEQRDDYHLTEVFQKAYINVSEEGTEAAAATSVGVGIESMPQPHVIDRSFIFLIREQHTGTVLFAGTVIDPTQSS